MKDRLLRAVEFHMHPTHGPLYSFYSLGRVQNREHRLGCTMEILSEMLYAARAEMSEDPVLWGLVAWFSDPDNMDYDKEQSS
jgi:hypothetical protein